MTPKQRELAEERVVRECLALSEGDEAAAVAAAEHLLVTLSVEELQSFTVEPEYREVYREAREFAREVRDGKGPVLSMTPEDQEAYREAREYATQYRKDRADMRVTLSALDAALSTMDARGAALSMMNRPDEEPTTALLYGAGPVTVGNYGFPAAEVGSPGSGALDTATGGKQRAKGKGKASRGKGKGKARRRRTLPKRLRVKKKWGERPAEGGGEGV
jgi:hypothetical protein